MPTNRTYIDEVISKKPFGWEYSDPDLFPSYSFEEIDPFFWRDEVLLKYWTLPFYVGPIYIITIFGLQRYMRDRPAFNLQMTLFWWNLVLGVFSIIGFARTFPGAKSLLSKPGGFYASICLKKDVDIPSGYWALLFVLSKFWELGDTIFIVLRKRKLIFLQWYHHLVTMAVVWILAPYMEPINRWYCIMNFFVHSLMYPYFAFKAIGFKIPNGVANLITTLQLAQMIVGLTVNMLSMYYTKTGQDCVRYDISINLFSLVYGSFMILFGKLFYDSVIKSGRAKAKKIE